MLSLEPHIHLARLGDDVVLLDERADAYVCAPGGVLDLRPSPDGAALRPADPSVREALLAAGYVVAAAAGRPRMAAARPGPARPARDFGAPGEAAPTPAEFARLGLALADALVRYRGRAFHEILDFARRAQPPAGPGDAAEALRLARLFQRLAPWLPLPRKCLVRSFVLLRFLQRSGVAAQWVFGVRTWPFSAHCWIQHGEVALDDHWDRLLVYEPILAAG